MSDSTLSIGIEDLDKTHRCPVCSQKFNKDEWGDIGGYHYRSGGATTYVCPTEGCDGKVRVNI